MYYKRTMPQMNILDIIILRTIIQQIVFHIYYTATIVQIYEIYSILLNTII